MTDLAAFSGPEIGLAIFGNDSPKVWPQRVGASKEVMGVNDKLKKIHLSCVVCYFWIAENKV